MNSLCWSNGGGACESWVFCLNTCWENKHPRRVSMWFINGRCMPLALWFVFVVTRSVSRIGTQFLHTYVWRVRWDVVDGHRGFKGMAASYSFGVS